MLYFLSYYNPPPPPHPQKIVTGRNEINNRLVILSAPTALPANTRRRKLLYLILSYLVIPSTTPPLPRKSLKNDYLTRNPSLPPPPV